MFVLAALPARAQHGHHGGGWNHHHGGGWGDGGHYGGHLGGAYGHHYFHPHGHYVPYGHFHYYLGSQHPFHLHQGLFYSGGFPYFYYGGAVFLIVDPLPAYWGDNWYDADDLYLDWSDGYALYNLRHPGDAVRVSIVP